jgi:hypothetical protein
MPEGVCTTSLIGAGHRLVLDHRLHGVTVLGQRRQPPSMTASKVDTADT